MLGFCIYLTLTRDKFFLYAVPYVFIGYPTVVKGYKLYNIKTRSSLSLEMWYSMTPYSHSNQAPNLFSGLVYPLPCQGTSVMVEQHLVLPPKLIVVVEDIEPVCLCFCKGKKYFLKKKIEKSTSSVVYLYFSKKSKAKKTSFSAILISK